MEEGYEYEDAIALTEEQVEDGGRLRAALGHVVNHPRLALGGGSLAVSFAVDIFVRFDPFVAVLGFGAAIVIGFKGDDLVRGTMQLLVPGSDQEEAREIADRFAEHALADYPVFADQSVGAKLRRLLRLEEGEVVEADDVPPPQPKGDRVKTLPASANSGPLTYERIVTWFEHRMINDEQFFALLQRIDDQELSPIRESGETVNPPLEPGETSESAVKFNAVSPTVSPEDEAIIVRTAFALQAANGKVTREEIKAALGWNNKRHGEIKAICDKYGIAMQGGK